MTRWHLIECFTHAMAPRHVIGSNRVAQMGSPHRDYLISIDDFPSSPTTHRSNSTRYPDTSLKFQELINQHLLRKLGSHKSNNLSARSRPRRSRIGLYPTRPSTIRNRLAAFNDPLSISFFSFFRNLPAIHPALKTTCPVEVTARCTLK